MKRVTLTDAVVIGLSKNPAAVKALPVLSSIQKGLKKKTKGGCSKCGQRRRMSASVMAVRTALANNPAALKKVKQILKADRLVLYVRNARGTTQRREV